MALADLEVVLVVAGRHFQRACAKIHLDVIVGNDGHDAAHGGHAHGLANELAKTLVVRVDGHSGIRRNRLGPRGGDVDVLAGLGPVRIDHRVADRPERAVALHVVHLLVGDDRLVVRVPVDEVLALVDEALLVERHEDGAGRPR